jgi:hypothetical protein
MNLQHLPSNDMSVLKCNGTTARVTRENRNVLLRYAMVCLRVLSHAVHFNGGNDWIVRDWFEFD